MTYEEAFIDELSKLSRLRPRASAMLRKRKLMAEGKWPKAKKPVSQPAPEKESKEEKVAVAERKMTPAQRRAKYASIMKRKMAARNK